MVGRAPGSPGRSSASSSSGWAVWAFLEDGTLFVALLGAGLAKGAIVSLAALGFVMIMKATGIANFAQGDLITVGAFLGLWATSNAAPAVDGLGLSLGFGYLLTLVLMFLLGVVIERVAYAPLRKRSPDIHVVVIATLGVAIIIRTLMALWQGSDRASSRAGSTSAAASKTSPSSRTAR